VCFAAGCGQEIEITAVGIRHDERDTVFPQKLALTSPTSGGCSVCIVRLRTQVMELRFLAFSFDILPLN
jgi:hypothetical protein